MQILFLTPMPQEIEPLLKAHVITERYPLYPDLMLGTGKLDTHDLAVGLLGIGKVNAAYATTQYITITKPDLIILFGTAGGVHPGLGHGTLYAARRTWTHDYGAKETTGFTRWEPGVLPIGDTPHAPIKRTVDPRIAALVTAAHPALPWVEVTSGDAFVNDTTEAHCLAQEGADLVDMESSVVADLAARFSIPTLVLRVVSDSADDDAHAHFTDSLERVCEVVTPQLLAIMRTLANQLTPLQDAA